MRKGYDIELFSGRTISLERIQAFYTYSGLLEGLPTKKMNDHTIKNDPSKAKKAMFTTKCVTLNAVQTKIPYEGRWPFGKPYSLPPITCYARFGSSPIDDEFHGSDLAIVWYQDSFPLPIDEGVIGSIKALDWNELARDFEY